MPNILKCDDCGNRFDARDKRGSPAKRKGETSTCPLCRALRPMFGYAWAVKNDCNGIFETYSTRRAAKAGLVADYADIDAYVVPCVVLEIPDDGMARIYANYAADDLEKYDGVDPSPPAERRAA